MKNRKKTTWKEWVTKASKEMEKDPMLKKSNEVLKDEGLSFHWDKEEQDYVATGHIHKKVH
jgi:hypothetical protein|tara:strand:+ start:193 stop:375 length:183 start_codon:yes stop_codon:yes gene_type:complete